MEKEGKVPIIVLCGHGSRIDPIIEQSLATDSSYKISLVVSHRKLEEGESDVYGIKKAKEKDIPTAYFNYVQMKTILGRGDDYREEFEDNLAAYILQSYFKPELVFMTGWMLVLSDKFLERFKVAGEYRIVNIHPAWLPDVDEPQDEITLPTGKKAPALRGPGSEVIQTTLELGLSHTGVTAYFAQPGGYDVGPVIMREWLEVDPKETRESLRKKLNALEDKIGPQILDLFGQGKIKVEAGKVRIL